MGKYDDQEEARPMFQPQEFRDATKRAGISWTPEVMFLDEVMSRMA